MKREDNLHDKGWPDRIGDNKQSEIMWTFSMSIMSGNFGAVFTVLRWLLYSAEEKIVNTETLAYKQIFRFVCYPDPSMSTCIKIIWDVNMF